MRVTLVKGVMGVGVTCTFPLINPNVCTCKILEIFQDYKKVAPPHTHHSICTKFFIDKILEIFKNYLVTVRNLVGI